MPAAVEVALLGLAVIALLPAVVLFTQVVAAMVPRRGATSDDPAVRTGRIAVLMPAHNEAGGIEQAIRAVLSQCAPGDRLIVIADNCSDDTAALARAAGAEVIERHDNERRGKGYALDFGVRWLERDPPAVVVVVDADCNVAPQALNLLATRALALVRPVQALYLMRAPDGAPLGMRIAEFAWVVKNKVRPLGSAAMGAPCQLMGTGMAFPWELIRGAALATGNIVEDMQLGLELASTGSAPVFCPEALVTSQFPTDREGATSQRTRWEHGHLTVIASSGPHLLWRALRRRDAALAALVFDLMVPPLAALVLLLAALLVIDTAWWLVAGSRGPMVIVLFALGLLAAGVTMAWFRHGRHIVTAREMLAMPLYVAAKIPVYIGLFTKRQVEWVRTKRDERSP